MKAYCLHCRKTVSMKGHKTVTTHGHSRAIGHCPHCHKEISSFVKTVHKKKH